MESWFILRQLRVLLKYKQGPEEGAAATLVLLGQSWKQGDVERSFCMCCDAVDPYRTPKRRVSVALHWSCGHFRRRRRHYQAATPWTVEQHFR